MAIGKAGISFNIDDLSINLGNLNIINNGKLNSNYDEEETSKYMKNTNIDISVNFSKGQNFTVYIDFNKKYMKLMQTIELEYLEFF